MPGRGHSRWDVDPTAIDELKRLHAEGYSSTIIAEKMGGLTRNAIIGKLHRLGLGGKPSTKKEATTPRPRNHKAQLKKLVQESLANQPLDKDTPIEQRRTLMMLRDNDCRWPVGDPGTPGFFFCGAPAIAHSSYCAHHTIRATNTGSPWNNPDAIDELNRLKAIGYSAAMIAQKMDTGVTRSAIISKLHRMKRRVIKETKTP
jgi:GcrA cell cycle regulator